MRIIDTSTDDLTALDANATYWAYNGLDVCITLEILEQLLPQLDETTTLTYDRAREMQAPFMEMMLRGIKVNKEHVHRSVKNLSELLSHLEDHFNTLCIEGLGLELRPAKKGEKPMAINWRSHTQVKFLLYDVLKLPVIKKRNSQGRMAPAADRETLEKHLQHYWSEPFITHILTMRDLGKQIGFLQTKFDADGRMRTNFNIAGTNTGRLSSSFSVSGTGTNLQNIAVGLRYGFVADEGKIFVNVDLEQADSRNVGALCWNLFVESHGEEFAGSYLDACESSDLHTFVCKLGWPHLDWGSAPDRQIANAIAYRSKSYRDMAKVLGHGCLTDDHQVLTPEGWVPIAKQPDTIMTWSQKGSEFAPVSNWVDHAYTGELQSFEGTSVSALMTHDHRIPYFKDVKSQVLHEAPAERGPLGSMPLGNNYVGGDVVVHGDLIAAIMSDGELTGNRVRFNFHKPRKIARIKELCDKHGVDYTVHPDGRISISYTHQKQAGAYMLNWTAASARAFLWEYRHWDGHVSETAVALFSIDYEHLSWIQTLGRLYGIGGNFQKPTTSGFGSMVWRLQQNSRRYAAGASMRHTKHQVEDVQVYCPTVPSSWFYVRRNGKIFVTGNSNYMGKPPTMSKHSHAPVADIEKFQRGYFEEFACIPAYHEYVINNIRTEGQLTHLYGRRRFFFGRHEDQSVINAAVAYMPQGMTGDEINDGILNLWRDPRFELLVQVHDSILFQVDQNDVDHLVPIALELLKSTVTLKRGREFYVPLEAQTGWNWGYEGKNNYHGLTNWKGTESRNPPRISFPRKKGFQEYL